MRAQGRRPLVRCLLSSFTLLEYRVPTSAIASGVAHVSFLGGGLFLPARTPYDRQMLVEHVVERAQAKGRVQVLVDDRRWLVSLSRGDLAFRCARCGLFSDPACHCATVGSEVFCARCALGLGQQPASADHAQRRLAG